MESRFAGKVAIVTGSSNGMGRATAILLAQQGARVTITGRNLQRLQETKSHILSTSTRQDSEILIVQADLATEEGQKELISKTIAQFGRLDILVNSAGAACVDPSGKTGALQDVSVLDKSLQIHLRTIVTLTQMAIPYLKESKGEIVNVSAIGGAPHGSPQFIFDSLPKAALDQFTRCTALEFVKFGVRVNSVSPGFVRTGFGAAMGIPEEVFEKAMSFMASRSECIPLGAVAEPSQIAEVIAFLADRKMSGYIIGQSIVVDGGSTLVMGADAHDMSTLMSL